MCQIQRVWENSIISRAIIVTHVYLLRLLLEVGFYSRLASIWINTVWFKIIQLPLKKKTISDKSHANYFHSYAKVFTAGDHIGVKLDYDKGTLTFFKNDKEVHEIKLESHLMIEDLFPCVGFYKTKGGIVHIVTAKQGTYIPGFLFVCL